MAKATLMFGDVSFMLWQPVNLSGWSNGAQSWCPEHHEDLCECTGSNTRGTAASPTRPKLRWAIDLQGLVG